MALYDPNEFPQEVETTKGFTLAELLVWARSKPADETYDYVNANNCAVAQFGRESGHPELLNLSPEELERKHVCLDRIARGNYCTHRSLRWTFGAFVARLEEALAQ